MSYRCLRCSGNVEIMDLMCMPPIRRYTCNQCGATKDETINTKRQIINFDESGLATRQKKVLVIKDSNECGDWNYDMLANDVRVRCPKCGEEFEK